MPQVVAFANVSNVEMIEKLCNTVAKSKVEDFYKAMFPDDALDSGIGKPMGALACPQDTGGCGRTFTDE
jgi:hypothetical protein